MTTHSLVVVRRAAPSLTSRVGASMREVLAEVVTFERTHARLAWGTTLVGLAIGLALQALG